MKGHIAAATAALLLCAAASAFARQPRNDPATYRDKPASEAAANLLERARAQADGGSWELIAVGRVFYLSGDRTAGQRIFDAILGGDHEESDVYRIARVYAEAGEWAKAKPLFDRYLAANPDDEKGLAEVGAFYLLNGDRETAESLFDRSFSITPEVWATIAAAGAYLGVAPQE
jgi:tetratricopeptide (TPR) repeat protein